MRSSIDHLSLQEAFESGRLRAQWTTYLLMGDAFFSLASIVVRFFQIKRFSGFKATERLAEIGVNDLDTLDTLEGLVSLAGMIVFLAAAVFFLMWIYRASRNLSLLGVNDLHYSPRLAACSFIIPFANLVASITFHPGLQPEIVSQRLTIVGINLISEALLLLAAVLAIRVIKAINNRQTESSQRIPNFGQPPRPPIFE